MTQPKLILTMIRHGEVSLPRPDFLYGAHDVNLSHKALAQHPALATELAKLSPQVVLTSHLKRCTTLARATADLAQAPLKRERRVAERNIGEWVGKSRSELTGDPAFEGWAAGSAEALPPGGESLRMVQQRILKVFGELLGPGKRAIRDDVSEDRAGPTHVVGQAPASLVSLAGEPLERVVWVSHGGVIRTLRTWVRGRSLEESMRYAVSYFGTVTLQRDESGLWSEIRTEHQLLS